MAALKKRSLFSRRKDSEVPVRLRGSDPAPGSALEKPGLQEIGLVKVFERAPVLAERSGDRVDSDRASVELLDDGGEDASVELVEAVFVDLQPREGFARGRQVDAALARHLGEVAEPPEEAVRDSGRAAAPLPDLAR